MEDAEAAQKRWELENAVAAVAAPPGDQRAPDADAALYRYDADEQKAIQAAKPWARDPHFFKRARISALALLKMAMHAKSGGDIEVMGVMTGWVDAAGAFVVADAFALPVEGTETRVNAAAEGYEYMVAFLEAAKAAGRPENVVGWYHSHPGYGCWLSGIDVATQATNQRYQEPFLAVVVDPHRTVAAGRVELGAFRTFPEGYRPPGAGGAGEYQSVPLDKVEDFGVHASRYYPLEVSYHKSALDAALLAALWRRHWVATLAASPLAATRGLAAGQLADAARKAEAAEAALAGGGAAAAFGAAAAALGRGAPAPGGGGAGAAERRADSKLAQAARDAARLATEQAKGLSTQLVKELLFNRAAGGCAPGGGAAAAVAAPPAAPAAAGEPMET